MNALDLLITYRAQLFSGLSVTLALCLYVWSLGLAGGLSLGVAAARWRYWIGIPSRVISFLLSGVPILVLLFWLHYPAQYLLNIVVDPFLTSVIALSIVNIFLVSDLVRGVIVDFPAQYIEAGKVSGLSDGEISWKIVLPVVFRQILPGLLSIQILMLQSTLFASLISVPEIFRVTQQINSEIYRPVELYTALGLLFMIVCTPLHGLAYWLRIRFTRSLTDR